MYKSEGLLIGKNDKKEVYLLPKMANRHGLITGASGTGRISGSCRGSNTERRRNRSRNRIRLLIRTWRSWSRRTAAA